MKLLNAIEVVQALEFGERVQMLVGDEWRNLSPALITLEQLIRSDAKYRLAHDIITIGHVSFPKPESRAPGICGMYYIPCLNAQTFCAQYHWDGGEADQRFLKAGLVHLARDAAVQHAKALIKLSGGIV